MTRYSNHEHRRLLSSPAVFPCQDISPSTLLTSLISLSINICNFQSRSFPTQRRNAKEVIRQVGIILIFLQELTEIPQQCPILCFSELHYSFQKILFLLQDCTCDGSRLWMLIKSQYVASQFKVLISGVSTALDVLPLHQIEVCDEVKELVKLVANQARKVKFEVDPGDNENSKLVRSILRQFEKGIEPELADMDRVLDYLKIKTWTDCNNEIEFLHDELQFQSSECEEREAPLLSGLIGFLSYCRGVIFKIETHDHDDGDDDSPNPRCSTELINWINPEDFRCPISLELMTDPVTVSTGQTYERASIQQWLKSGNRTCPKTGAKLKNTELIPNTTLRKLIQQFCVDRGVSLTKLNNQTHDIAKTIVPGSPAAAHSMQFLSWFLARRLVFGTMEEKNKAAYEVRLLARSNLFNRSCLIQVGIVSPLLDLVSSTRDKSTQENATAALLKLSKHNKGKEAIIENRGLNPIVMVIKKGLSQESRQIAAAIIFYLVSVKQYRKLVGENPEVIPSLVQLMKEGTACGKKHAMVAIFGLLWHTSNHKRVLEANTVQVLVDMLASSGREDVMTDSLAVLAALAENKEGAEEMVKMSAVDLITGILRSSTRRNNGGKEHCVSILLSLCVNGGEEVIGVMAKDASIMASLYSILTEGTSRAAKKARFLIRILQDFKEKPDSSAAEQQQTYDVIDLLGLS